MQLYYLISIIGISLFLLFRFLKKRSEKKRLQQLMENWGKAKDEKFNFKEVKRYFDSKLLVGDFHQINDQTAKDLDFAALFILLDRTSSKPGQQYFYNHLRNIYAEKDLKRFSSFSNSFLAEESNRLKIQIELSKMNHYNAYDFVRLFTDEPMQRPKMDCLGFYS